MNVPFFLPMVLYPAAILRIFGEDFAAGATALTVLAFATMVGAATGTCQGMLDMTGHTRLKLFNTVMNTVLLIGVGALLIPSYGAVGAAIASLVAIGAVNVASVIEVWVTERVHPYDRTFVKPVLAALLALAAGLVLRAWIPVTEPIPALVQASVVVAIYAGLLLAFGLEDQDRQIVGRVRDRVWRAVRRGRSSIAADPPGGSA
jgi:O-antigen/teichoic acid export membrane protein